MSQVNLPTGKWAIFGNEEEGVLEIDSVDSKGNIRGTAFGDDITGAYDATSGLIHFTRQPEPRLIDRQTYTGHIAIVRTGVDAPTYLLAGSYISIPFGLRPQLGWYATITKPIV